VSVSPVVSRGAGAVVKQVHARIRILIADDNPMIRKMVRFTLEQHSRFEVCGEAFDGAEAIKETKRLKPDVVVINVTMPVLNGIEAARIIKATLPDAAIVILSTHADDRLIDEAKKIGARAYVAKARAGEALVKAIEAAIDQEKFVLME
jgi:DNA-binding NarL/FixJ family response regulator